MAGFYRITNGLMPQLRELSRAGHLVFHVLAMAANRMGQCWWSVDRIAREIGLSSRQTARGIAEVVRTGLVKRLVNGSVGVATVYEVGNMPRLQVSEDTRAGSQLSLFGTAESEPEKRRPSAIPCHSPSAIPCHTNQTQRNQTNKTTTPQPVSRQEEVVVVLHKNDEEAEAVQVIMARTDAPRERAEAMARDYPLQVIQQKLALLAKAKRVKSAGAWLSAALAADYRPARVMELVPSGALRPEPAAEREAREKRVRAACDPVFAASTQGPDEPVDFSKSFAELRAKVVEVAMARPATFANRTFLGKLKPLSETFKAGKPFSHEFMVKPPADFVRVPTGGAA